MWTAAPTARISYETPWSVSAKNRLGELSARHRHVAYFYEYPDAASFRYRVFNMVQALNACVGLDVSASWFTLEDHSFFDRFLERTDALVVCRSRYDAEIGSLVTRARARGIPVLFDTDDLLFDLDLVHLILDTIAVDTRSQANWNNWFAYIGRLTATMQICDRVIVTNEYLAKRVTEVFPNKRAAIVPNFLNHAQQDVSEQIWDSKLTSCFARNNQIHIGYFSGTATHERDFEIAVPALARLMNRHPEVVFRIVGHLPLPYSLIPFHERIERFPIQDFLNLQHLIGQVEINLAPVQDNGFTNCKSELKYFEAAATGTLTIASPISGFRKAIQDGSNGFLARAHEWEAKLEDALALVRDSERCSDMIRRAHEHSLENYGWNRYGERIASSIFESRV